MKDNLGVIAALGVGVLAFVGGLALMRNQHDGAPAGNVAVAPAPPANRQPDLPKKDPPPEKNNDEGNQNAVAQLPAPTRPALLNRWTMAQPPQPKGEEGPNYDWYVCREIGVNQTGSRVVTQSTLEAVCWDTSTGGRVQTYKAGGRTVPRKPPDQPEVHIDEEIFITRDARFVARVRRDGKQISFHEAATGRPTGVYRTPEGRSCFLDRYPPAFTPRGDYLLFMEGHDTIVAVRSDSGWGRPVGIPANWAKAHTSMWCVLIAVPDQSVFIRHAIGDQGVFALDLRTGQERRLKSVTIEPTTFFENRGIKLSPNGRYLSARSGQFIVVDWKTDRQLMQKNGYHGQECFTPDGKRLLTACDTDMIQYQLLPEYKRLTPVGGWLELYDVQTGAMIGKCVPEHHGITDGIATFALSGDGKKFALADRHANVAVFDFELAFGVPPLPPLPRPDPEFLPTR